MTYEMHFEQSAVRSNISVNTDPLQRGFAPLSRSGYLRR